MKQTSLLTKTRKSISGQEVSVNAQLLERAGYISKLMAGVYTLLPLGERVIHKIENIVRQAMDATGAQEILMPSLHPREPWDTTGRWEEMDILYRLKAGDRDLCLGPTHEEIVVPLVGAYIESYKDLPRAVYQIQTKFRNEARPKSGLLRGREFKMKDLYSFHAIEADLDAYYSSMREVYTDIFNKCGLGSITYFTYATGGTFSKYSHEFQTIASYGEDTIFACDLCKVAVNKELIDEQSTCPSCNSASLTEHKSIEVANIFKLMHRFTRQFGVTYSDAENNKQDVLMGCYGLGITRLMGAVVEALHDDKGIIWPVEIAPYRVHLISLSKKPEVIAQAQELYDKLQKEGLEILFDDRVDCSAGEKFADADLIGIPFRVVVSDRTIAQDSVEVKQRSRSEAVLVKLDSLHECLTEHMKL